MRSFVTSVHVFVILWEEIITTIYRHLIDFSINLYFDPVFFFLSSQHQSINIVFELSATPIFLSIIIDIDQYDFFFVLICFTPNHCFSERNSPKFPSSLFILDL